MADGVQDGCATLIRAAIPVTCGQDMEVPDAVLKCMPFFTGVHAASIFNPEAWLAFSFDSQNMELTPKQPA